MAFSFQTLLAASNPPIADRNITQIAKARTTNALQISTSTKRSFPNITDEFLTNHEEKLKKFRNLFCSVGEDHSEVMAMIDALQRLGIDYHFKAQIGEFLEKQYTKSPFFRGDRNENLNDIATFFRLSRQQGYYVPEDVFENFIRNDGKFYKRLKRDIKGLMSLYEASQLSIEGEDILHEAMKFSSQALTAKIENLDFHQAAAVQNTLQDPYHKSVARIMAKRYITNYRGGNRWINVFQEMARNDFKMVQFLHQKEIVLVSKWWNDLGLAKELKLARDQPLKWHIWSMICLEDPCFSEHRLNLTKAISLIYLMDDIFDVYGTLEELTLFTEAVNRWDLDAVGQLPDYMKNCYKALLNVTHEISDKVCKEYGWNPLNSLRKMWINLCNAFLVEAKWLTSGKLPNTEEYLENAIVSSGVPVVLGLILFLLGGNISSKGVDDDFDHVPAIVSPATILRLWDDLGSAKDKDQKGKDGSYLNCYVNDYRGVSVECAERHAQKLISQAWKRLNKECISSNPYPPNFIRACLNLARTVPLMYDCDDNSSFEDHIHWLVHGN